MSPHEVLNQPPPLEGYDVFESDPVLPAGVARDGAGWAADQLRALGVKAGSAEAISWGFEANTYPPVLRTHDRYGHRVDQVDYHPSYHRLMETAVTAGLHAAPWSERRPGAHVARAAGFYLWSQVDAGHGCPISMTYSVLPALEAAPALAAEWRPLLTSRVYDPASAPAPTKRGALAGMGMTEKQGGSDVRANTTYAEPSGSHGSHHLTGHKWFCSAPMSDLWLMLARSPGGLSCFLVPRWAPDGTRNAVILQRLKDKLGNKSNASSEIELEGAAAYLVGEEGRGVATIIEMVSHTRLDCVIGAASGMRQAVAQAVHHAAHRRAFGKELIDQPLMQVVLADLAVESEAATTLMLRLARAYDQAGSDEHERAFRRLGTAIAKYWVCKRQPPLVAEALECLGGNGYVEESILPRLFRESPLNGIWEGSGNVICLDVLRAMSREPRALEAYMDEVRMAGGADARFDAAVAGLERELADLSDAEARARRIVERMALVLQGALLVRYGHPAVADAFCASRLGADALGSDWGRAFGTLPPGLDTPTIVERARPKLP
ncbi:isovaleryl-CoA dehydrogenase [Acidiferrimicrobium sp. IK]|uniref:isovaleryl-CoA dehydrogenase n=1 Tax=Acidiferrimicrobium sp. IK TaxID=2871700 RepID=UPI0021CB20EB|nr:isovaleryl-CoA dehydrogenase [Acidiferrimicrobium sp. IK]MCU4183608.1 isovaleryl-CoA dehydrogenase [Acidiferrimicrobium sp. IK]